LGPEVRSVGTVVSLRRLAGAGPRGMLA